MAPELRHRHGVGLGSDLLVRPWAVPSVDQARASRPREKSAKEMQAEHQHRLDQRPLTVYCALCGWTATGPAGECKEQARLHRDAAHPRPGKRARRDGDGLARWSRKGPTPEQLAESEARKAIHEKAARRKP